MDDATFEAQQARFKLYLDRWFKRLGLGYLRDFTVDYYRDGEHLAAKGHEGATAVTSVWWEYKDVLVEVDCSRVEKNNDAELEYVVVHELMHIFIQQVVNAFKEGDTITDIQGQHVERTAVDLAQAFLWIRDFAVEGAMGEAGTTPSADETPAFIVGSRSA